MSRIFKRQLREKSICVLLAAMVFIVFGQTLRHDFVNYDDDLSVYANPQVAGGLSPGGIAWAFTHSQVQRWVPLTTISHMLDCQLYGLRPWGHHLTNVLLHGAAAIVLFLALRRMTGKMWRSAFVAAVFAIHPLRAEAVAWVSERGEVLGGLFFMLALLAYARYAQNTAARGGYFAVIALFALGLMCKPAAVAFPFVLLLLDYWPLRRFTGEASGARRIFFIPGNLIMEKIPLFALSACACGAALLAQKNSLDMTGGLTLPDRIGNALVSYSVYLKEMIWPEGLAVLYPHPGSNLPAWEVLLAIMLLASISTGVFLWRRKYPFLVAGWLWYLGMLVPMIGLIQTGAQAHADRYTYLPQIGLYFAIAWLCAEECPRLRHGRAILGGAAAAALCILQVAAWRQASWWRDSISLWTHALECTRDNYIARNNLGVALARQKRMPEAIGQYHEALRINPGYAAAHQDLGTALLRQGETADAITEFQEALRLNPVYADAFNNLGAALFQQGQTGGAIVQYREALRINPDYADAHGNLGAALCQLGRMEEGIAECREALRLDPGDAVVYGNLGTALFQQGQTKEAIASAEKALALLPADPSAMDSLAWMLATAAPAPLRDGPRALELAGKASLASGGNNPAMLRTLAAAYSETGQFPDALRTAQSALQLAEARSNTALADALRSDLKRYEAGLRFDEAVH